MINNLKKIEKSIKDIVESKKSNPYLKSLHTILIKERFEHYQSEEVFLAILKNKTRGLDKPDFFKKLKLKNEEQIHVSSTSPLLRAIQCENMLKEHNLHSYAKDFYSDRFFSDEVLIRTPAMLDIIVKDILGGGCRNIFEKNQKKYKIYDYIYPCEFVFEINMLNEQEQDDLKDICLNLNAYLIHPDIGKNNLKKEVENILGKYYNLNTIFIKNPNNQYYYEIEVLN